MRVALKKLITDEGAARLAAFPVPDARRYSVGLTLGVLAIALITLVFGWWLDQEFLVRIQAHWPAMVPSTAGAFVVAGLGVLHWLKTGRRWALLGAAGLVMGSFASAPNQSLWLGWLRSTDGTSVTTQVQFILTGLGMIGLVLPQRWGALVIAVISTIVLVSMNVALVGYFFHRDNFLFDNLYFNKLALTTIICFLLLHIAILLVAPGPLWVHMLLGKGPGSQLLRLLLPAAFVCPVLLGQAAYLAVASGHVGVQLSIVVMVVVSAWAIVGALFMIARWINGASQQERMALKQLHDQELALSHAEAMAARVQTVSSLGRVSGGVAHEFNNLLSIIQGNLELIRETRDPLVQDQFLQEALSATQRGAGLTQKLLSYGEKSVLNPEDMILDRKIAALQGVLRRFVPPRILLIVQTAADRGQVHVDQGQLEQAVISLVANAAEAIRKYGRIELHTGRVIQDRDWAHEHGRRPLPPGRYLFVAVEDTGCGIAEGQIDRITEPFYSTKSLGQSAGLGLSMVHGFCQQSGGFLEFESTPGAGSRFTMYFPERPAAVVQDDVSEPDDVTERESVPRFVGRRSA